MFGRSLGAVWADWIDFEREFQRKNLAALNVYPTTQAERLSPRALGSVSRAYYDADRDVMIAGFRYPGVLPHIGALDLASGEIRKLSDIKGSMPHRVTSIAYDPESKVAWYTTDNYAFRDIVQIDTRTGKKKTVLQDGRVGDLVLNPKDKSLWGVRHLNGAAALVRLEPPYEKQNLLVQPVYGNDFFDLDISPDGSLLALTAGTVDGVQTLNVYRTEDVVEGALNPIASYQPGPAQPEGAAFSPDGRYVYFSSYLTGVSNLFRMEIETGGIEAVSNAETGYVRSIPLKDGSVIVFEFAGDGFTPVRIQPTPTEDLAAIRFLGQELITTRPELKTWNVGPPSDVNLEDVAPEKGVYRPRRRLRLGSIHPVIEGYKGNVAAGIHINIEDPAFFNQVDITLSYSPGDGLTGGESFHADVRYQGLNWRGRYWHNDADFYDLFGPTKRARKGDAFIIGYDRALIYDDPRVLKVGAEVGYYTGLDTLPQNQNVGVAFEEILATEVSLSYSNTQESLGSVDHEKGWRWHAVANVDRAAGDTLTRLHGGIDFGLPLPIKNSSLWLYNAGGLARGNAQNPLGSFYFGGFKNNYVDDREVKRYRQYETLPGFEIDEIDARHFAKSIAEWNMPPVRFESVGTPELYVANARPAIFGGVLIADRENQDHRTLYTLGAQVDFNFTLAHRLPMTFSVGYAAGFESGESRRDEALISLKIM